MAITGCDKYKLEDDIVFCTALSVGIKDAILINEKDIIGYAQAGGTPDYNVFSGLTLAATKKGYEVADVRQVPFDGTEIGHEEGDFYPMTTKTVQFVVNSQDDEGARIIDALNGGFVILIRYKDDTVEIIGKEASLRLTDKTRQIASGNPGWLVTMSCTERTAGNYLFDTDAVTTVSTYESLLTAASA